MAMEFNSIVANFRAARNQQDTEAMVKNLKTLALAALTPPPSEHLANWQIATYTSLRNFAPIKVRANTPDLEAMLRDSREAGNLERELNRSLIVIQP